MDSPGITLVIESVSEKKSEIEIWAKSKLVNCYQAVKKAEKHAKNSKIINFNAILKNEKQKFF